MSESASAIPQPGLGLRPRWRHTGITLAVPSLVLLSAFFVIPLALLLLRSILEPHLGLQNYSELAASLSFWRILSNTFVVATIVTATSLALGFPVAWLLVLLPRFWSALLFGVVVLSMWTNLLTRTFSWMVLLQSTGVINKALLAIGIIHSPLALINNLTGITIGMTYIMLPFIIMPLHATMSAMDPSILRAASLCGARRWQVFFLVLLPGCRTGIAAGCLMVYVMSLGYFVTPALLGGASDMMLAEWITQLVQSLLEWGLGGAAAFVLLAVTLCLYALQLHLLNPLNLTNRTH